jgi:hypothetical protein
VAHPEPADLTLSYARPLSYGIIVVLSPVSTNDWLSCAGASGGLLSPLLAGYAGQIVAYFAVPPKFGPNLVRRAKRGEAASNLATEFATVCDYSWM